jgi:hypothetical protein
MKITIDCCLCATDHVTEVALPDGWAHRHDAVHDDMGFCPTHAAVAAFADSQCPGCVGGWGDCPMWRAFAYGGRRDISTADFEALERGVCPRRVNGTIGFNVGQRGVHEIDLSERAPPDAGRAFAQAIRDYCAKYPSAA